MHHQDQGTPLLVAEAADRLHQLHRVLHVEVVEGLVEQQAVGLLGDGHGEVGQLPLPAAQLVEVGPAQGGEGEKVDGLVDRDAVFPGQVALAVGEAAEGDQFVDRQSQPHVRRLAQGGDPLGVVTGGEAVQIGAPQAYSPLADGQQAGHGHQQGALAGAVGADQRGDPTGREVDCDVAQDGAIAVALMNLFEGDHGDPLVLTIRARK